MEREVAQSYLWMVVLLLKGKCPTMFNPSMGRLHRVLALRVLLPLADDESGLEGQLWQSSKSQPCSCLSLKVGQTNSENILQTQPSPQCVQGDDLTLSFLSQSVATTFASSCTNRKSPVAF